MKTKQLVNIDRLYEKMVTMPTLRTFCNDTLIVNLEWKLSL